MKHGLGGIAFENEVRDRFQSLGWQVERTPVTGDYGADLVATFHGEILAIQCKDYGSPAGVSAIQEVHFARSHYDATAAVVVARNGFTKAAIRAAATTGTMILRPSEVTAGCSLDRSPERREFELKQEKARREAEIEQQRWRREFELQQQNQYYSQVWREYDSDLVKYKKAL
jgi:hypothetical protein